MSYFSANSSLPIDGSHRDTLRARGVGGLPSALRVHLSGLHHQHMHPHTTTTTTSNNNNHTAMHRRRWICSLLSRCDPRSPKISKNCASKKVHGGQQSLWDAQPHVRRGRVGTRHPRGPPGHHGCPRLRHLRYKQKGGGCAFSYSNSYSSPSPHGAAKLLAGSAEYATAECVGGVGSMEHIHPAAP